MSTIHLPALRAPRLVAYAALLAGSGVGCSNSFGDVAPASGRHGDMQAHFEANGSLETECGTSAGVRVEASGPDGATTGCDAAWAAFGSATSEQYIADCFFVVEPGHWTFTELTAIDEHGEALSCCNSELPDDVNVQPSETSEVGGVISCNNEQNGGLDVFVTINRPPVIIDVDITPSKFGPTCAAIGLVVEATDSEGDDLGYEWEVVSAEAGADYSLEADGHAAAFASKTVGDYEIRVTARDELGASAQLDFPLHIIQEGDTSCDARGLCLDLLDLLP